MNEKVIIISAPSGAGKTTIVKYLLENGLNLAFSVSATTRAIRGEEKNGKDYFFITTDEFRRKVENDEFVEWEQVYDNLYYGTLKSEIRRIWESGNYVLFDVDVNGGINLKKKFGENALAVFIMPPSIEELRKRLEKRGTDSSDKIAVRISKAAEEIRLADKFDTIIINDNLDTARKKTLETIKSFLNN